MRRNACGLGFPGERGNQGVELRGDRIVPGIVVTLINQLRDLLNLGPRRALVGRGGAAAAILPKPPVMSAMVFGLGLSPP